MKNRPIHENLDTSFVNLSALVRYLQRRQFAGSIRVEMSGYEADIALTAAGEMSVREHDRIAGRISEGDEALQRLLIRAREPGGIINVYRAVENFAGAVGETMPIVEKIVEETPLAVETKQAIGVALTAKSPHRNGNSVSAAAEPNPEIELPPVENAAPKPPPQQPEISFDFGDRSGRQSRAAGFRRADWQTVLNLTAELLNTLTNLLLKPNLEFAAAFREGADGKLRRLSVSHSASASSITKTAKSSSAVNSTRGFSRRASTKPCTGF
jgi:hypothetical protein